MPLQGPLWVSEGLWKSARQSLYSILHERIAQCRSPRPRAVIESEERQTQNDPFGLYQICFLKLMSLLHGAPGSERSRWYN